MHTIKIVDILSEGSLEEKKGVPELFSFDLVIVINTKQINRTHNGDVWDLKEHYYIISALMISIYPPISLCQHFDVFYNVKKSFVGALIFTDEA